MRNKTVETPTLLSYLLAVIEAQAAQIAALQAHVADLEVRVSKNSHNSSKPPSSDGYAHRTGSLRQPSDLTTGGQRGHPGHTLPWVAAPDVVEVHRPQQCSCCGSSLERQPGTVHERRQVRDLPPLALMVTEHQVETVTCAACGTATTGTFPDTVTAPAQYGAGVRALVLYLRERHFLPEDRVCETLADLFPGCQVSPATLENWVQEASTVLVPTMDGIAQLLAAGTQLHGDETGGRIGGKLHWFHVACTAWLTHLQWHAKRGKQALEAIRIWPAFQGRGIHDRWSSYTSYGAAHSLCGAHLLRDLTGQAEAGETWAGELKQLLEEMELQASWEREQGASRVPAQKRDALVARYFEILSQGFAAQPPPPTPAPGTKRRGKQKQSSAKNLLDALLLRAEQVLGFLADLSIPFTNNQAERDLRMMKVQQKVSGTFRSEDGATAFCRIYSYLSTMKKQGQPLLPALAAVCTGTPFSIAWGT